MHDTSQKVDRGVVEAVKLAVAVATGIMANRLLRSWFASHALFDLTDGMSAIDLGVQASLPQ